MDIQKCNNSSIFIRTSPIIKEKLIFNVFLVKKRRKKEKKGMKKEKK